MERSGFWIRAGAAAIDAVVFLVFAVTIGVTMSVLEARGELTETKQRGLEAMLIALWLLYSSMEAMIGATAGKLACGIVIALPDGAPAPPWTRVLRWATKQFGVLLTFGWVVTDQPFFYAIAGLLNFLIPLGCLRALGEDKQAWHDVWAHTAVVPRAVAAKRRGVHEHPEGPPTPT